MLKNLTYQQRIMLTVGLTAVIMVCAYFMAFKKTFELKKQVDKKEYTLSNIDAVKAEMAGYENLLKNQSSSTISDEVQLQNLLYEKVSEFCSLSNDKLDIASFQTPHSFDVDKKSIQTCSFSVKGNFRGLVKLNEALEKELDFAQLAGVKYELIEKYRSKELIATFYIQNVNEI